MRVLVDRLSTCRGTTRGGSPRRPAPTPTTRCCPRRSKAGRWRCSSGCCRAISRSSTRSMRDHLEAAEQQEPDASDCACAAVSLIDEADGGRVRMGHLAFVGSHRVNGVSVLHTELMRKTVFNDFHRALSGPHRQQDQRHHLPPLAAPGEPGADQAAVRGLRRRNPRRSRGPRPPRRSGRRLRAAERLAAVKHANKRALARLVRDRLGLRLDPAALFDVQIKRIHEYKRQLLNLLETIARYQAIRAEPTRDWVPRVKIFAGKAAPSYAAGKADHQARQRCRRGRSTTIRWSATG